MGQSLGNLKDSPVKAPSEPTADALPAVGAGDVDVLESRLEELNTHQRDLLQRQEIIEREAHSLRTDSVLGKLDDIGNNRLDSLREQLQTIADSLRETARLKKTLHRLLTQAHAERSAIQSRQARERTLRIQQAAGKELDDLREDLQAVAIDFAATWALANGESASHASTPDLIRSQIDLRTHREAVIDRVAELEREYGSD